MNISVMSVCSNIKQKGNLTLHKTAHHTIDYKYQCAHCDQVYNSAERLKTHMTHHTGEKP